MLVPLYMYLLTVYIVSVIKTSSYIINMYMCVARYRLYDILVIIGGGGNYCHIYQNVLEELKRLRIM